MARVIRSMAELSSAIDSAVTFAVDRLADEAKKAIQEYIQYYYDEYTPKEYVRTYTFLNSLLRTDVSKSGNTWTAKIYVDTSLGYYNGWTVMGTAEAANRGWHGWYHIGMSGGIHFWDEAMIVVISPEFANKFAGFLRSKGLNVIVA